MKNEDLYAKPPRQNRLLNNGVASVNEVGGPEALRTLRYELETFVCDGEYAAGLERILRNYIVHLSRPEQPGVWVSGFYGSGKSHLVKVLRALWVDQVFPSDGATARGILKLPPNVRDVVTELATETKRVGAAHAASGTPGSASADSVRLAVLAIVFRSVGLSEQYDLAKFELWLRSRGVEPQVRDAVEAAGKQWHEELGHLHVSPVLHRAVLEAMPDLGMDQAALSQALDAQFRSRSDVSSDEMISAIRDALTLLPNGKRPFPLTLIALDEIEQYIGQDQQRSYGIQEATEACCKSFGGRLLFVGTGQSALAGPPLLTRLMGRFPVKIELSDTDVESVIRKVILAKRPDVLPQLEALLTENLGEISRHLAGTKIGHRTGDQANLAADYPLLPVRSRLWEKFLRSVDFSGASSQLRTQLRIVLEAVVETADAPVGTVVTGDFIFDQIAVNLFQAKALSSEVYEAIRTLQKPPADDAKAASKRLKAKLLVLIYLIGKLPRDAGADQGVRATPEVLADLLLDFLPGGSTSLRIQLPDLLDELENEAHVMRVDDEYRLRTKEGGAWHQEYLKQLSQLQTNPARVEQLRVDLLRQEAVARLKPVTKTGSLKQGVCAEARNANLHVGATPPKDADKALFVWVRDGWEESESAVETDAMAAGNASPLVFAYFRRHANDELRRLLISQKAAEATLAVRGEGSGPDAEEARAAMVTRVTTATGRLSALINEIFAGARVFQAGGQEILEGDLVTKAKTALERSLVRLYPKFDLADQVGWDKVIDRAKKGSEAALEAVGHKGDVDKHDVTAAILAFVGNGKKGADIRKHFEDGPYGWSKDAIDGGLYALVATGHVRATDAHGVPVDAKQLDRAKIAQTSFRTESIIITVAQRIQIRKVLQAVGVACNPNEELAAMPAFLSKLKTLMAAAGGEAPRPSIPSATIIHDLETQHGNAQLLAVHERREELTQLAAGWKGTADRIEQRIAKWTLLSNLLGVASPHGEPERAQAEAIREQRLLLAEPDPVPGLLDSLTNTLRQALVEAHKAYAEEHAAGEARLDADPNWQALTPEQRHKLRHRHQVLATPDVMTGTAQEVLASLVSLPLSSWADRTAALPTRYRKLIEDAAELLTPDAVVVKVPRVTVKSQAELDAWVTATKASLETALAASKGAGVVIQ